MKRFICAISACALVLAVGGAYSQGKKEEDSKSSASQGSSSTSRSSSSQSSGRSSSSQTSTGRSQNGQSTTSSSRNQSGSLQRGAPSKDQGSFGGSTRNQGGSTQRGAPTKDQGSFGGPTRNQGGSQQRGAPAKDQGSFGGQQYGAPSRTDNPGLGSNNRSQGKSGSGDQAPPPTKADNPPPRGQGQGSVPPPRGQGGDKGTPPASGGGKNNPPVNQGPPTRTDSGSGKVTPPRPVGPPIQTNGTPKFGGGTVNLGRPKTGPIFDSRTGGIKPTDKNHNIVGPPTKIGPGSGVTIRDGRGRGFDGGGVIPRPTTINDGRGRGLNSNDFRWKVLRHEDYRSSLRNGYCHSNINWCDWWFGYRYYYFDPTPYNCVFSPYYGYYCVPGYISLVRCWLGRIVVIVVYGDPYRWNYCGRGTSYNFYSTYYEGNQGGNYTPLDRALSNLSDAFKYGDEKLLDRIVDRGSEVQVFIDNEYAYTMSSDDYFDITSDLIKSVQTTNFSITQVKRSQEGGYVAVARHDYRDTWNVEQTNWLTFTFREDRGQYFLTQAGTAKSRPNF